MTLDAENEFLFKKLNPYWNNWEELKIRIPSIINFFFIRNLFEKELFKKDFQKNRENKSNDIILQIDNDNIHNIHNFVVERYKTHPERIKLLFTRNNLKKHFDEMLVSCDNAIIIKWLLVRVYRLRNNTFHWVKDLSQEEDDFFAKANEFIMLCMNLCNLKN